MQAAKSANQVEYPQKWELPTAVEPVEVSMDQRHTRSPDKLLQSLQWKNSESIGDPYHPVYCAYIYISYIYMYHIYICIIYIYMHPPPRPTIFTHFASHDIYSSKVYLTESTTLHMTQEGYELT